VLEEKKTGKKKRFKYASWESRREKKKSNGVSSKAFRLPFTARGGKSKKRVSATTLFGDDEVHKRLLKTKRRLRGKKEKGRDAEGVDTETRLLTSL